MKLFNTILLASAAGLAWAGHASAADLPFRKAAPVEYMRVCDAFGEGFFYIPGTDTCLHVGGSIRAEFTGRSNAPTGNPAAFARNLSGTLYTRDTSSLRARGYLNTDARTQTAYGAIRTFVSIRITDDTTSPGPYGGGSFKPPGAAFSEKTSIFQGFGNPGAQTILDKGFIQFAGFTAGRAQSFFDFDAQSYELLTNSVANSNQTTEMFAYTATFGGGFSATASVEDRTERSIGDNGTIAANNTPTRTKAGYFAYAGESIPDIVGNVRYDGAWGSAQLAAAYHDLPSIPVTLGTKQTVAPSTDGFAALAGVKILLPFIAKADSFTIQGTYEEGAMDYVNPVNYQPNGLTNIYSNNTSVSLPLNDAFIVPGGKIGLNKASGVYGAYRHYWVPTVYSSVYGDYLNIRNPRSAQLLSQTNDNADVYQVGFNTVWAPIKDFQLGAEVLYSDIKFSGAAVFTGVTGTTPREADDFRGRLSLRRSF